MSRTITIGGNFFYFKLMIVFFQHKKTSITILSHRGCSVFFGSRPLILHTPGGDVAATECIIKYLRQTFNGNVRAIVPQIAMSGGTLIALSAKSIVLGHHSSLGPVDPQIGPAAAQGYLEEFDRAWEELQKDPAKIIVWRPILEQIPPTILTKCSHAVKWSEEILEDALTNGMFADREDKASLLKNVIDTFGNQKNSRAHRRHIDIMKAIECGLVIEQLEHDPELKEHVLSLHHLLCLTLGQTDSTKVIASSNGQAFIMHGPMPGPSPLK